jgi:amino acid adenylation domain-containing protein
MNVAEFIESLARQGIELWFEGDRLRYRAPKGTLTEEQRRELSACKNEVVRHLRDVASAQTATCALSYSQQALWFVHQQKPDSAAYHVAMAVRITSEVSVGALTHALKALVDRHAILRTTYQLIDDGLVQQISALGDLDFEQRSASDMTADELRQAVEADYRRRFDLAAGPLLRASLYTRSGTDHVLLLALHHIAVDAWSLVVLFAELLKLYAEEVGGHPAALGRHTFQYADYVKWQREMLASPTGEQAWSYWRQKLAGPVAPLNLPTDYPRPALQSFCGASLPVRLEQDSAQKIKDLARAVGTTPFVVMLASFKALLFALTGSDDLIVGIPTFGRSKPEFMQVVGDFVNSVPVRSHVRSAMTFRDLIAQLRMTVIEALDFQEFPLPLLVERLQPSRDSGRSPLFDTFFNFIRFEEFSELQGLLSGDESAVVEAEGLRLGAFALPQQEGQFDLSIQFMERSGTFQGAIKYRTDLFKESTICKISSNYVGLLEKVAAEPEITLGMLRASLAKVFEQEEQPIAALIKHLRERSIRISLEAGRLRVNAPKGVLDDALKATIASRRDDIIALLNSEETSAGADSGIRRIARQGALPVSSAQQRFWLLEQMAPGRSDYNIGGPVRLRGLLDIEVMKKAINDLVARHESFRISIKEHDGAAVVELLETFAAGIEVVDLRQTPDFSREAAAHGLVDALLRQPFDMARGPLARFLVIRMDDEEHMLVVGAHHAVSDGWSSQIAFGELLEFYDARVKGRAANLPDLTIQYVDYAAWEREQINSGRFAEHLTYWKRQLQGAPALLELPTDRPRPAAVSFRGGIVQRYLKKNLIGSLETRGREHGATLFMVLLAAWQLLLHRYSGQDDIVVGSPFANRDLPELEKLVGCLVNSVVLRSRLDGNSTFGDFLKQVKQTTLSAFEHRELPFEMLLEELNPSRTASHAPIFQVLFNYMSFPSKLVIPGGLSVELIEFDMHTSRFDLSLDLQVVEVGEHKGELHARYEYAADLFDERTIARLHTHFEQVLAAVAADPSFHIQQVPLRLPEEEQRLMDGWNATAQEHDRARCLHTLLEQTAIATPHRPAVTSDTVTLSYSELDLKANQLAHHLVASGVRPGDLVAVCLDRTVEMPIALAAVLKAGAAYVPLDPTHPAERLRDTLEDAEVSCTITLSRFASLLDNTKARPLPLDELQAVIATQPSSPPGVVVRPADLAYVIYTSGSTGRPKGVQIEHRNVVNFIESMRHEPGMNATDVLLAVTTLSFDIAGLEIWLPLSLGARIVIASREDGLDGERLISLIETHGVTILQATPSTWRLMLDAGWVGKGDLKALCGGEAMRRELALALIGKVAQLWNMYGPTETTIWSTASRVVEPSGPITIGRPIANTRIYVLDPTGRSAPVGMTGELCIGGEGVARGYWKRPELTSEKFVPIALSDGRAERVYRTGDIARFRWDGELEFFGRRDHQVKVRGYRIELGEIETILATLPGIKECAVIVREDEPGDERLVAYVAVTTNAAFDTQTAGTALRAKLPGYMIPNQFVVLPALPLTPNGKIDRKALPVPDGAATSADDSAEILMNPMQRRIAGIWSDLLRVKRVSLHANFFDLGGHSLLLAKLHASLKREFGVDLALIELFQKTTVAAQADRVSSGASADSVFKRAQARAVRQARG